MDKTERRDLKNYYFVLGVMPTAPQAVIRAAYRALCQIYHPDKYEGDKQHGEMLLVEFNEAWAVLSDPVRRREYDKRLAGGMNSFDESSGETDSTPFKTVLLEVFPDLEAIADYYPDIWNIITDLQVVSRQLAGGYIAALLETKAFKDRLALADALRDQFFRSYFGNNAEILRFAELLVLHREKDALKELNRAVNLFGIGIEPEKVIGRIDQKYKIRMKIGERNAEEVRKKKEQLAADLARQAEQKDIARKRALCEATKAALQRLDEAGGQAAPYSPGEWIELTKPLRELLNMSLRFDKAGGGFFSSFSDVAVFANEAGHWRVPYKTGPLSEWIAQTLVPMAKRALACE